MGMEIISTLTDSRASVEVPPELEPRTTLAQGRFVARAWAQTIDPSYRLSAARAFVARVISYYGAVLSTDAAVPAFEAPPSTLTTYALDHSVSDLAASMGTAASKLEWSHAHHLISITYTAMLPDQLRARHGIYYTPPALAARLLTMSTEAGIDWATCRVLDPACGCGAFLAPAAHRMMEALSDRPPTDLVQSVADRLRGFEIDAFAAWMSQTFLEVVLATVCRAAGRPLPNLVSVCNSLEEEPSGPGFDLVIGNPPYGRISLTPDLRSRYRRSLYGHANQYGVFTDLAVRLTNPGGVIAFVTPTSFLAGEYFKALRALLAHEAPPAAVDFVADRKGVFEDVLQEALLATYRRNGSADRARVHFIVVDAEGSGTVTEAGEFRLPDDPSQPWLLPRTPEHGALVTRLAAMPTRLADWGYKVSTGPLVWNRHKDQLRDRPAKHAYPLIWAEAIAGPGRFVFRAEKRNHQPYFEVRSGDGWLTIGQPCVLVQRTTAKEQSRRLIAAELPERFVRKHGLVVVENHLNMIRPLAGTPKVSPAVVAMLLNSEVVDNAFRCISGSVAVSAFELEALPLPSVEQANGIERLIEKCSKPATIEKAIRSIYLGPHR